MCLWGLVCVCMCKCSDNFCVTSLWCFPRFLSVPPLLSLPTSLSLFPLTHFHQDWSESQYVFHVSKQGVWTLLFSWYTHTNMVGDSCSIHKHAHILLQFTHAVLIYLLHSSTLKHTLLHKHTLITPLKLYGFYWMILKVSLKSIKKPLPLKQRRGRVRCRL